MAAPQSRTRSVEAIVADINRTLQGWFAYFKHIHPSELEGIDQWMREIR